MYKNKEGYTDPTAGAAMATIMKEYRLNQRRIYRKHSEIKARPKVYVVSKYAGDIEGNTAAAIRYARFAIEKSASPWSVTCCTRRFWMTATQNSANLDCSSDKRCWRCARKCGCSGQSTHPACRQRSTKPIG